MPRGKKRGVRLANDGDKALEDLKLRDLRLPPFMSKKAAEAEWAKYPKAKQDDTFIKEMEIRGIVVHKICLKAYYIAIGQYAEGEVKMAA